MSAPVPKPTVYCGLSRFGRYMHFAYLDEFGHIGPYVAKDDPRHNTSPVFGLAGMVLPAEEIRGFSTWFFQRKGELLRFEIEQSEKHPAEWEKKGASLYTTKNIERYPELTRFTKRFLNKIERSRGRIFYVGVHKTKTPDQHNPRKLYQAALRESIKRLNQYCEEDCAETSKMLIVMDEHQDRDALVTEASRTMFNPEHPQRHLIEPPMQVESHRYQTVQAADWICGLVGRLGAHWTDPASFGEFEWAERIFGSRIKQLQLRSGIRHDRP
jgi:hypothetical protein